MRFIPQLCAWRTLCPKLFLLTLNHLCLLQRKKLPLRCLENQSKGNICSKLLASNYCLLCIITYWSNVTKLKLFSCACFYALLWYKMCGLLKINLQLKLCPHTAHVYFDAIKGTIGAFWKIASKRPFVHSPIGAGCTSMQKCNIKAKASMKNPADTELFSVAQQLPVCKSREASGAVRVMTVLIGIPHITGMLLMKPKNPPEAFQGHKPSDHWNWCLSYAASSEAKTTEANHASSARDRQPLFLFSLLSTEHSTLPSSLIDWNISEK